MELVHPLKSRGVRRCWRFPEVPVNMVNILVFFLQRTRRRIGRACFVCDMGVFSVASWCSGTEGCRWPVEKKVQQGICRILPKKRTRSENQRETFAQAWSGSASKAIGGNVHGRDCEELQCAFHSWPKCDVSRRFGRGQPFAGRRCQQRRERRGWRRWNACHASSGSRTDATTARIYWPTGWFAQASRSEVLLLPLCRKISVANSLKRLCSNLVVISRFRTITHNLQFPQWLLWAQRRTILLLLALQLPPSLLHRCKEPHRSCTKRWQRLLRTKEPLSHRWWGVVPKLWTPNSWRLFSCPMRVKASVHALLVWKLQFVDQWWSTSGSAF